MTLGKRTIQGASWNAVAMVVNQFINLARMAILARLLSPADFGLFAMATVFITFFQMFGDMGTSSALIQNQKESKTLTSSVFYLNIGIGILLTIILFFISPVVGFVYNEPRVTPLLQQISIVFFITSLGSVHNALLQKELCFKRLAFINMFAAFISSVVCVYFAWKGFSVLSLIYQTITYSIIITVLLWFFESWRPKVIVLQDDIKSILFFTTNLTGFNLINYFSRNTDNFLVGRYIGSAALGVYDMAYKMLLFPLQRISWTITNVLFSAFSKIQDDSDKFKNIYLRVVYFIAIITFPLMLFSMALSDLIVSVLFGPKWSEVSNIFIILAPLGVIQSIVTTTGTIYMSKGRTDLMFRLGVINTIVTLSAFLVGLKFGIRGVAIAYVIANLIMLYPNLHLSYELINLKVREMVVKLFPILFVSIVIAAAAYLLKVIYVNHLDCGNFAKLIILSCFCIGCYLGGILTISKNEIKELRAYL